MAKRMTVVMRSSVIFLLKLLATLHICYNWCKQLWETYFKSDVFFIAYACYRI